MLHERKAVMETLATLDLVLADFGPIFARRCAGHDTQATFVADNFLDLQRAKAFSAGVPEELGGGGASHRELCEFLRGLAGHCGSTALAFAMHTHLVAVTTWRWRNQKAPVEGFLKRVAQEELCLISTGGADWLDAGGIAEKVEGGFLVTGRKAFSSGCPAGRLLMTSAVHQDSKEGPQVLHFGIDLQAEGVRLLDTWHTLGMRGTGSHDIELTRVFVPDAAIGVRRPQGRWHMLYHIVTMLAFPLIYAVYLGLAESARDLALEAAAKRREDPNVQALAGAMENELTAARLAYESMLDLAAQSLPGPETSNSIMIRRALVARHALATAERAMEVAGGASFYESLGLERLFRDIQAARFHPLQDGPQRRLAGRMALGLPIDGD
jgi:alkylation response protein AidB-like acyl-CoA dehydrogenase